MSYRLCTVISIFLTATSSNVFSQQNANSDLQDRVNRVIRSTVRIETNADRCSGVLVSKAGHILTVAHGLKIGQARISVLCSDKRKRAAKLLHRDEENDVAILQLNDATELPKDSWLPVSMKPPVGLGSYPVALACGFPARESADKPVVRIGQIESVLSTQIRSTCPLTTGDSGGPLVDSKGQLLAINARIGKDTSANIHIRLSVVESSVGRPELEKLFTAGHGNGPGFQAAIEPPSNVSRSLKQLRVRLFSSKSDLQICSGTLIASDLIASKLSEIQEKKDLTCQLHNDKRRTATLVHSNSCMDLGILKLSVGLDESQLEPRIAADMETTPRVEIGDLVYSYRSSAGIVARCSHSEPRIEPWFGCSVTEQDQSTLVVDSVSPNSAAQDARLRPGDILVAITGKKTATVADIQNALRNFQPGDVVKIVASRGDQQLQTTGRLRPLPGNILNRTEFLDGRSGQLSRRATGFDGVIQHDCGVGISEIGGPLVNVNGQLVGINIARRARESVLAIPIAKILQQVDRVDQNQR